MTKRLFLFAVLALLASVAAALGCSGVNSVDRLDAAGGGSAQAGGGSAQADAGSPCVNGDGTCPSSCTADSDSDCPVDMSGVWFTKVSAAGSLSAADGALTNDATISASIRLHISSAGGLTLNVCKLTVTGESALATTYPPALIKTLQTSAQLSDSTSLQIGGAVHLPAFTIYSGQTSTGSQLDTLPPPFPAGDGDGKPGVTIPSKLKVGSKTTNLDIYAGLVITTSLSGLTLADASTISGSVAFKTEGVVFDSTSLLVGAGMTFTVTTTAPTIALTATKLDSDGSHDCASIAGL